MHLREQSVCWMVHVALQRAVEVGERLRATAEAHVGAEVVAAVEAVVAFLRLRVRGARNARLDGDSLADLEAGHPRPDRSDDAARFVAEHKRRFQRKVAVATVGVIVVYGDGR